MQKMAITIALIMCICLILAGTVSAFENETSVDAKFEIITGSGSTDYYAGDYFWYNITLLNSGSTPINTTFKVSVLNTTGGLIEPTKDFPVYLNTNDSYCLYPNYTRLGRDEHSIFYFENAGTYKLVISSQDSLNYYRFSSNGGYTYSVKQCEFPFDVMPSYQRTQNDNWNDFLSKNKDYMQKMQENIDKSDQVTAKNIQLTWISLFIAAASIALSFGGFFVAWCDLSKEKQKQNRWFFRIFTLTELAVVVFLVIMFWIIG